ncbi:glycosyltransferase family 4 protein [Gryllotalpicola ginsengisoli]|uniref:glycosyltransferase family 4 protein n=1 Tax=Gryllotalpicola ginsengisoli TaxID=444608 RepID=UPI00138AF412|nr:glycosyltransferase family 1 protein [Gryllotalpicola ginsengisoli]
MVYSPGYNAGLSRARQIVTIHDLIHLQHPTGSGAAKRAYYDRVARPAIRRAAVVMTVSETSRDAIVEWLADPAVAVENVGNGCSEVFSPDGPSSPAVRDHFLYVGAIKAHKNFDVLLRALSLRPAYRLAVVSSDSDEAKRRVAEAGLDGRVRVTSRVSDPELASIYRGSIAVLFPSLLEGFGLPAVEAMRCGKRVAYWHGCASLAEIVADEGPAVGDAQSPEEWANAMDRLLDPADVNRLLSCASEYSWPRVAANVRRVLAGVS